MSTPDFRKGRIISKKLSLGVCGYLDKRGIGVYNITYETDRFYVRSKKYDEREISMKISKDFFETIHNRNSCGDIKYHLFSQYGDLIPLWIADMDFRSPPSVDEAICDVVRRGIYGYFQTDTEYDELVRSWYSRRMNWSFPPEWLLKVPGVMFSIAAAIRALTDKGDSVMICQPVYYPFANAIQANKRNLVISELQLKNGRYEMDFADIEGKIAEQKVKIFLLCSPHNPVGRVWTSGELTRLGEICQRYDTILISDEIHSDFVFADHRHIPIASLSENLAHRTITCISPTKTFNLAGIGGAGMVVPDSVLRRKIQKECISTGYGGLNMMAIAAAKAVYREGEPWLNALLSYLQENVRVLREFCSDRPIRLIEPEGTYLMWLDCRELSPKVQDVGEYFLKQAHVQLHKGEIFGAGGNGFVRMNIACPKSVLLEALNRMDAAIKEL